MERRAPEAIEPVEPRGDGGADDQNLVYARSAESVEDLLGEFYGRFPWPWRAAKLDVLDDPWFETVMLRQEIGDREGRTLPPGARIWVAGCGTNQALLTALRFPHAAVEGTDVSLPSLERCAAGARALGVDNLELRHESIQDARDGERYDFVISTGVIHHNRDPQATLAVLARRMKRDGLLELMVYNRFRRTLTSSFQKAIRLLAGGGTGVDFDADLELARRLVRRFPAGGRLADFVADHEDWPEEDFADLLIQPVEHSYTVASLAAMAEACGLRLERPCISLYAKHRGDGLLWELDLEDRELAQRCAALPDVERWQLANLLLHDTSPLLWFYLRRGDATVGRRSELQLAEAFLAGRWERAGTTQRSWLPDGEGGYRLSPRAVSYPVAEPPEPVRAIYERADGERPLRQVFSELGIEPRLPMVSRARSLLTTPAFPYLRRVEPR